MVNVDDERDYYADLELAPNADPTEINKQFKKLAKLNHPDRNHGNEEEAKAKFQVIQAAYEVLSDPQARIKYDLARRRHGYTASFARPDNTTRNRYSASYGRYTATSSRPAYTRAPPPQPSDRQPPPRRQSTPPKASQFRPPPPSPSAEYWRSFQQWSAPKPPPSPSPAGGSRDDAKARAQAFENIRHAAGQRPPGTRPDGEPTNDPSSRPGLGRSKSTKTPRKSGFDPSDIMGGWEPQASKTSSYARTPRQSPPILDPHTAAKNSTMPPPPTRGSYASGDKLPRSSWPSGSQDPVESVPFPEGKERTSSPYMAHSGERTYFNDDSIRRSASVRDAPRYAANARKTASTANSPQGTPRRPRSTSPSSKANRHTGFHRPSSNDNARSHNTGLPRESGKPNGSKPVFEFSSGGNSPEVSSSTDDTEGSYAAGPFGRKGKDRKVLQPKSRKYRKPSAAAENFSSAWNGKFAGSINFAPPPMPVPNARNTSKTKNSPMQRAASPSKPIPTPSWFASAAAQPPTPSQPSAAHNAADVGDAQPSERPSGPVKFSSEDWTSLFKEAAFIQPQRPSSASPSKPTTSAHKPSKTPTYKASTPKSKPPPAFVVDDSSSTTSGDREPEFAPDAPEAPLGTSTSAPAATASNNGADKGWDTMDLDTPPQTTPVPDTAKGPRLVNVQPNRPEWRDNLAARFPSSSDSIPSAVPQASRPPPPPPPPQQQPQGSSAEPKEAPTSKATSVHTQHPQAWKNNLDFSEFAKNAPFAPAGAGLKSMADLSDSLPFESRASLGAGLSFNSSSSPKQLALPPCPRGPEAPSRAVTESVWKAYLSRMSVYMGEWHRYNSAILQHFNTRNANAARFGTGLPSSDATKLLEMVGEFIAGEPVGIRHYLRELKEDEDVRQQWNMACIRHQNVVSQFVETKDAIASKGFARGL